MPEKNKKKRVLDVHNSKDLAGEEREPSG